ncbi:MAG: hypothetical protein ACP5JJ_06955 [Anaerolineae bacterium]
MWNPLGMQMMEIQLQEMLHPEATERLAREGSVPTCSSQQHQWLCGFGRLLIAVGQRLQRVGRRLSAGLEEPLNMERHIGA